MAKNALELALAIKEWEYNEDHLKTTFVLRTRVGHRPA